MRDILGERDASVPDTKTRVAEPSRESQLPKRFYESATVEAVDGSFRPELDGRPIRTPGRAFVAATQRPIAERLAQEWGEQGERIDPMTMPLTRLVNTAIDGVATDMQAVREDIVRYAGTDLICYRAGEPEGLVTAQNEHWDPMVDWAQSTLGCRFILAEGVMHVTQPPESLAAFGTHVAAITDPLRLAALHVVTSLTGSATLAMAVAKGELECDEAWKAAHVDEDWNISQWGEDAEAKALRDRRFREMTEACFVLEQTR